MILFFCEGREGAASEAPSELSSISSQNGKLSFVNKGMATESQHETGNCVDTGPLPKPVIGGKEEAKEEQEKSLYQCLKDSQRPRVSVYEPLKRKRSREEVSTRMLFLLQNVDQTLFLKQYSYHILVTFKSFS